MGCVPMLVACYYAAGATWQIQLNDLTMLADISTFASLRILFET